MSDETHDFTPSMERIRDDYVRMRHEHFGFTDLYAAEFDRTLARHDANVRAEALREAARYVEDLAAGGWGGSASWLTTGTKVGGVVRDVLHRLADEAGESRG